MEEKCKVDIVSDTKLLEEIVREKCDQHDQKGLDNSILITDLGDIARKHQYWMDTLPTVEPFYAVKCNDDPKILSLLVKLGCGFDCASQEEIRMILKLGARGDRIIYANTIKHESMIRYAASNGVDMMTFDNEEELMKISKYHPTARLVLRIKAEGNFSNILYDLRSKFGCFPAETPKLFQRAKSLGLNIVGVSFHVGSGCQNAEAYTVAIRASRDVFDIGRTEGYDMTLLDIGGGFLGGTGTQEQFAQMCTTIKKELSECFSASKVRVIAEPGRYFVESAQTLCIKVIGKRVDYVTPENLPRRAKLRSNSNAQANNTCTDAENPTIAKGSKTDNTTCSNSEKETTEICRSSSQTINRSTDSDQPRANSKMTGDTNNIADDDRGTGDLDSKVNDVNVNKPVSGVETVTEAKQTSAKGSNCKDGEPMKSPSYFMNDGLYGHLAIIFYEPVDNLDIKPLKDYTSKEKYPSTLWGPTCDSLDMIWAGIQLPELEVGDWLYLTNGGAYWSTMLTLFNRMPEPSKFYFINEGTRYADSGAHKSDCAGPVAGSRAILFAYAACDRIMLRENTCTVVNPFLRNYSKGINSPL